MKHKTRNICLFTKQFEKGMDTLFIDKSILI